MDSGHFPWWWIFLTSLPPGNCNVGKLQPYVIKYFKHGFLKNYNYTTTSKIKGIFCLNEHKYKCVSINHCVAPTKLLQHAFPWSIWDLSLQVIHRCLCHGDGCNKSFESAAGSKSNQWPLFIKTSIYATRDYLLCVLHITTCATKLNMLGTEIHVNMFEF